MTDYAYQELERHGLPLFRTALVERSAYKEMFLTGEPPTRSESGKGAGAEVKVSDISTCETKLAA